MIRINLLGVERKQVRSKGVPTFDIGQQLTVACSLVLVGAMLGIGYWFWYLNEASTRVDREIVAANAEATRLRGLLMEVQQFEARKAQLTQRVQLIEQLRGGQSVPVQLLDHVSRSLPDMLWLTSMVQNGPALTIQGRSTTLIALSDFVTNLGTNPLLIKPIEIVSSEVDKSSSATQARPGVPAVEMVRFTVKAQVAGVAPKGRGGRKRRHAAGRATPSDADLRKRGGAPDSALPPGDRKTRPHLRGPDVLELHAALRYLQVHHRVLSRRRARHGLRHHLDVAVHLAAHRPGRGRDAALPVAPHRPAHRSTGPGRWPGVLIAERNGNRHR